jgi:putative ABC transport system permease protein
MRATVDNALADPSITGDPYDLRLEATGATPREVTDAIRPYASSWTTAIQQRAVVGSTSFLSRALGGDIERAGYVIRSGHTITAPDEAIAGWGLLDELGWSVGDRVRVEINGKPLDLTIVGRYSESEDTGRVLQLSLEALRRVDPEATPTSYLLRLRPGEDANAVAASLHRALGSKAELAVNVPEDTSETDAFTRAFNLVTLLVIVVSLAFLASTMLLAVRERSHDLGVMRAVGFTPVQVAAITVVGAVLLAAVGALAGVPLGLAAYGVLADAVGSGSGLGPGIAVAAPAGRIALSLVALVGVAAILGALVARRPAGKPIAELVRDE